MINKLCQIVDTVKLHYYHVDEMQMTDYTDYVNMVESFITQKEEAQKIHHSNNDMRFVNTKIGSDKYRVMATTFRGFSVTLRNQDVSISFKTVKLQSRLDKKHDTKHNQTHTPIIKVEFRASFLARVGHVEAMRYINETISTYVLKEYLIKVSEIHLATDIQGYNFTELDYYRFKTLKRNNIKHVEDSNSSIYYNGRNFTGFTFGSGDEMLRIYDKTVEIQKNPDKAFIKNLAWIHNKDYDQYATVWRIEIQYRREKLKTIYTDSEGLLDGFQNVINAIPDLWGRALQKVEHKDMSDNHCLDMIRGYSINKEGQTSLITKEAITKRYQRADTSELWLSLNEWNGYVPKETNIDKAPKTSAFQWVSNSIKSLLTTLLRHSGELSPKTLEMAFSRSNDEIYEDKQITLIDNAYANTLDYVSNAKRYQERNGVFYPINKLLDTNLEAYVHEISLNLFDDTRFNQERVTYLNKALERAS
ncbi:hypothetical protein [Sulfurimonas sp.]|uniref:hypothetical protein n=1 Tax=Sulfurimonas sp. TaxID=2022749 RepID=UPI00356866F6